MSMPKRPAMKPQTQQFLLRRRELLKSALLGTAGYGMYNFLQRQGIGGLSAFLAKVTRETPGLWTHDAAEIIADALRFGPSLLFVSEAMAATSEAPGVYRVFYETSHDIRNELHLLDHGPQYNPLTTLNYGAMTAAVQGKTRKAADPHPIMNEWAYKILTTGKIDGTTAFPGVADKAPLTDDERGQITVIASIGMTGSEGVHRRAAIPRVGTLEYAMLQSYSGYSPIGSVTINNPIIDSSGGVNNPGLSVGNFIGAIDVPAVYMSRAQEGNPVRILDNLTGDRQVKAVRDQMLDAHALLTAQLEKIKGYAGLAQQSFPNFGARKMEGLAAMMLFADLFGQGLATVGSTGLNSFDFHATDATRTPNNDMGNMLTETAQALAGTFHIARAAIESEKDAIVHFTTCSNRNESWVNDDSHVSTLTFIIKGSASSPFKNLPPQIVLLPDNADGVYAEGPGNGTPTYSGEGADKLGISGKVTVGQIEAGIVKAAGKAAGKTPALTMEEPAAKLLK